MAKFTISSTHHTSFTVSDLARSLAFFRDGLGFTHSRPRPRDLGHIARVTGVDGADVLVAFVHCPGHTIELIEYSAPQTRSSVRPHPCDVGFAHVCFMVDDIDAAVARAAEFGVKPCGEISHSPSGPAAGAQSVYLRDHDGITYELAQAAAAAADVGAAVL